MLLLPQPEEARSVPVRAGDQTGDLGQARVPLPGKTESVFDNDDPVDRSGPFADQLGAWLEPALAQCCQDSCRIVRLSQPIEQALRGAVEPTEGFYLQLKREGPEQHITREAGGG